MAQTELAILDGNGVARAFPVHENEAGNYVSEMALDTSIQSYRAGKSSITPVATPTTVARLTGAADKVIRLKRVIVSGIATAAGNMEINVTKRSSKGTDGSAAWTAITAAPLDSDNDAATATAEFVGTANQTTLGTSVGVLAAGRLQLIDDGTTAVGIVPFAVPFGDSGQQAVILRSATENVTVDLMGDALPSGGNIDVTFEWTEQDA